MRGIPFTGLRKSPKIVKILTLQQLLEGFVPITALYVIMFDRVGGLDLQQIGWLFAIWGIAFLIAELPSGVLADYWSRKNVIILGGFLRASGFLLWLAFPNFWGYAVGFALWGVAITCSSGSVGAYLHNELEKDKKPGSYSKYYGWTSAAYSSGLLLAYCVSAILTLEHTSTLITLGIVASLLASTLLIFSNERPYKRQESYLKTFSSGLREVKRLPKLRYLCYVMFVLHLTIGVLEELLPRLYERFGSTDTQVSIILALTLLANVFLLTRMEAFVRFSLSKQVLVIAAGALFFLVGLGLNSMNGIVFILLFSLTFNLFRPVFSHHIQGATESEERATVGSIPGVFGALAGSAAYIVIGQLAAATTERASMAIYATFWLIVLVWLAIKGRAYN